MTRPCASIVPLCLLVCCASASALAEMAPEQLEVVKAWLATPVAERAEVATLDLPDRLSEAEAIDVRQQLWQLFVEQPADQSSLGPLPPKITEPGRNGRLAIDTRELALGKHTMPYVVLRREQQAAAETGRPLFICLHGGGANPKAEGPHAWPVNSRELQAQVRLALGAYPSEGIYWIPRMADDRLGRWWHAHNQQAIDQVIDHAICHWGVDPNRVYLLGISEGGYGTDILSPFMADRFAAASAMAAGVGLGNPPENLRNVAFRTDVGERDDMFDRRKLAVAFHQRLDQLHADDPLGYLHHINVQQGRGHAIDYRLGPGWIAEHHRQALPQKLVWIDQPLDRQRRQQFYWLRYDDLQREGRNRLVGEVDHQAGRITLVAQQLSADVPTGHPTHIDTGSQQPQPLSSARLTLLLSDDLLDLDRAIEIVVNGEVQSTIEPNRSVADILQSLVDRPDPTTAATCRVELMVE